MPLKPPNGLKYGLLSIATLLLISCSHSPETKAKLAFRANVKALNEENIGAYMATLDRSSPGFAQTKPLVQKLFRTYDLKYKIDKIEVVKASAGEIELRITQTTRKIRGPEFNDNRMVATHTLKAVQGEWKIYDTQVEDVESL